MQMLIVLLAGVVLIGLALMLMRRKRQPQKTNTKVSISYTKKPALLSKSEQALKQALEEGVGNEYAIYAKVRLADILTIPTHLQREAAIVALNQLRSRSIDFVLCDKQNAKIRCVIQSVEKSEDEKNQQQNVAFIDQALAAAHLPFVKVNAAESYQAEEIKKRIQDILEPVIQLDELSMNDIKIFIEPEQVKSKASVEPML